MEQTYLDDIGNKTKHMVIPLTKEDCRLKTGWYIVNDNLSFEQSLKIEGDVHLILADESVLSVESSDSAVTVTEPNSLTIYAQSENPGRMGRLVAQSKKGAGIGGYNAGTITINGGHITAACLETDGSGIGGGYEGKCGTITINGGFINIQGGAHSPGIGGGIRGIGGVIDINKGKVNVQGGYRSIGILGTVTIRGGVTSSIGGVDGGTGISGNVLIENGELTAIGGFSYVAHGTYGGVGVKGNIVINSGTLISCGGTTDRSGYGGAGIHGTLTVNGNEINAAGDIGNNNTDCSASSFEVSFINANVSVKGGADNGAGMIIDKTV